MEKWEWDEPREEFFPPREEREWWWDAMDFEGDTFEGCDCEGYEEHFEIGGEYSQNLDVLTSYHGVLSGEEITHYRCPYCGRDFYVYTDGDFKNYQALEEDL